MDNNTSYNNINLRSGKIAPLMVKYSGNIIKSEQQASAILVFLALIFFIVAIFIFVRAITAPSELPPEFDKYRPSLPQQ